MVAVTTRRSHAALGHNLNREYPMKVEVWSDIFCPFCYIGKRKFEQALEQFPQRDEVEVVWHSFQLNPEAPLEFEGDVNEMLANKYGMTRQRAQEMNDRVTHQAAEVGLVYKLDQAQLTNSFDAHRLSHLAAAHGKQDEAEEALFTAYFTEGRHLGRHETLAEIGSEIGLDAEDVAATLASDAYAREVNADIAQARSFGINGVPFFIFDRTYAVSGAQPSEVFLTALQRTWADSHPLTIIGAADAPSDGDLCTDDSCAVPTPQQSALARG
jgi:predicted DsbA family dithiol-disulfide isomerase